MNNWHLLYCKARNESRAVQNLENQGLLSFYPQFTRTKLVRGKRSKVVEPIFPNYVFVALGETANYNAVRSTRGVSDFVRIGNVPVVVPDELVKQLMSRTEVSGFSERLFELLPSLPQAGDNVVIINGVYRGLEAVFQEADGLERSVLLIRLLNQDVSLTIDNRAFQV